MLEFKEDRTFKFNVPYLPRPLLHHPVLPEGVDFAVEVYVPEKEKQIYPFESLQAAKEHLAKVRILQEKGAILYARIILRNYDFSVYPDSKRIRAVPQMKGTWYCPECNDYTAFDRKYGYEGSEAKHCQYCGLSDNDWYVKSLNGLWGSNK